MGEDEMATTGYGDLIIAFFLSASLWVVCNRYDAFCTRIGTQGVEEFADELCTICKKGVTVFCTELPTRQSIYTPRCL